VLAGFATMGDVFAYILFINMLFRPIRQLADRFNTLQMGMVGSERVFKVLDTDARILPDEGTCSAIGLRGEIRFDGLWFAYADGVEARRSITCCARSASRRRPGR
jgi:ATP-binding cassette subfamily B multidrug efflux pump